MRADVRWDPDPSSIAYLAPAARVVLLEGTDARNARGYLRSRGFDGDAARRFKLGYSPSGWDDLARHLQQAKFSRDDITGAIPGEKENCPKGVCEDYVAIECSR